MRFIFALLFCTLLAAPARAADNYEALFNGRNMWLNTARPVTLEDAKGRAVLLDFWTYGCINCMQVVPELKALEKEFGDKLLVIGVHSAKFTGERDSARIQAAAKRFGVTHPVINDSEFKVWNAMGVKAWPTLVLLGPDGREAGRYAGEGNKDAIAADIKKLSLTGTKISGLEMAQAKQGELSFPARLEIAKGTPWGDMLFVADTGNNRIVGYKLNEMATIRKIAVTIGAGVEGHEDGGFDKASFNHPRGFAATKDGIYIADTGNHMLRYADFKSLAVTTLAGTGERGLYAQVKDQPALNIPLASPWDAAFLKDGKTLVIAMAGLHQLWTYDTEKKTVSTLAGTAAEGIKDGPAAEATLAQPSGIAVLDDAVYFVDAESSALRVLKDGQVKTLVGTGLFDYGLVDGTYPEAMLQHPQGLWVSGSTIYIADTYNNAIREYDIASGKLTTGRKKELSEPADLILLKEVNYIADAAGLEIGTILIDP